MPRVLRLWLSLLAALLLAWGLAAAGQEAPPGLPESLRGSPADPRPGTFLSATGGKPVWAALQALDGAQGFGVARAEGDGKVVAFRLLPYTRFQRFGAPGAEAAEFSPGERVQLELVEVPAGPGSRPVPYALSVADEITDQFRQGRAYRIQSQDRREYRFTVEPVEVSPQPPGSPKSEIGAPAPAGHPRSESLAYGPETSLVLREAAVHSFNAAPGTVVRINTGTRKDGTRAAREVLDEASATRFRKQQELRLLARAAAAGAPAVLLAKGTERQARLFPDYASWARALKPGDAVRVAAEVAFPGSDPPAAQVAAVEEADGTVVLTLKDPLAGHAANAPVRLARAGGKVDYDRDVRPVLEVNCAACHGTGRADSGFSVASPERLRAGGRRGPALVPGKSGESLLYGVMSGDRGPHMPPDRDLTPAQLSLLKAWIDAGAKTGSQQ